MGIRTAPSILEETLLGALCCYSVPCRCVSPSLDLDLFESHAEQLKQTLLSQKLSVDRDLPILKQFHYASILILAHLQTEFDVPLPMDKAATSFLERAISPLIWLAQSLFTLSLRPLAVQILEWLLYYCEKMLAELVEVQICSRITDNCITIRRILTRFLAEDLVNAVAQGPRGLESSLNSYYHLIGREDNVTSLTDAVILASTKLLESSPDPALVHPSQVMVNLGTALISHRSSFSLGKNHAILAHHLFHASLLRLPAEVGTWERDQLQHNVRVSKLIPSIIELLGPSPTPLPLANLPLHTEPKDLCSSIQYVVQMMTGQDTDRGAELTDSLFRLGQMFMPVHPDVARKCIEWATSYPFICET